MIRAMLLVVLCASLPAAAAEHDFIRDNDKDGDKKLSWEEIEHVGWTRDMFDLKDMDGDGKLSTKDLWDHVAWLKTPAINPKIMRVMNSSGDGILKKGKEWWWDDKDFDRYDANKDGLLDAAEIARIPKAKPQRKAKPAPKPKPKVEATP